MSSVLIGRTAILKHVTSVQIQSLTLPALYYIYAEMSMSQDSKNNSSNRSRSRYYLFAGVGIVAVLVFALYVQSGIQGKGIGIAEAQIDGNSISNNNITREISVTGEARKLVDPDKVALNLGVETQAKTASEAARMNSEIMNKVIDAVTASGVEKEQIGTNYYAISPVYNQEGVLTGYKATNSLVITLNADADIGRVIDAAVSAGANQVYSVNFFLSQEMQSSIVNELMEHAVIDAKNKAEKILAPLGAKLGDVKNVSMYSYYNPPMHYAGPALYASSNYTVVLPQKQEVFVSVNVTFLIEGAE